MRAVASRRPTRHEELVDALEGLPKAKHTSRGEWQACCPAHEDDHPSFGWNYSETDGSLLLKCQAGCASEDILAALGFSLADLYPANDAAAPGPSSVSLVVPRYPRIPASRGEKTFNAYWTDGTLVPAVHRRVDDGRGGKPRHRWDPDEVVKDNMHRLAFFNVGDLRPGESIIVIVEGERAALALKSAGYPVVGTYGTGWTPSDEALEPLRGLTAYAWPDNDPGGHQHMAGIAARLTAARMISPPPDAAKGWDAADAVMAEEFELIVKLMAEAVPFAAQQDPALGNERLDETFEQFIADADKPIEWAVQGVAVRGSLTLVLGLWESFKSWAVQQLLVAAATGEPWLGLEVMPSGGLYVSNEKTRQTVARRFRDLALDKEPSNLRFLHRRNVKIGGANWDAVRLVLDDFERLGLHALAVFDTLSSTAPAGFNENEGKDMNAVLDAIHELQGQFDVTAFLLHHPPRDDQARARGHGSLDGDIDGTMAFHRSGTRSEHRGQVELRPKDGELRTISFEWDPNKHLLRPVELFHVTGGRDSDADRVDKDRLLLQLVQNGSFKTLTALADILGQAKSSVSSRVTRLRGDGLLTGGGGTSYAVTETGSEWLADGNPNSEQEPE